MCANLRGPRVAAPMPDGKDSKWEPGKRMKANTADRKAKGAEKREQEALCKQ